MASVTYSIKGKYDGKAVKQAQSGFASLTKSVTSVKNIFSAIIGAKIFQTILSFGKETSEIFEKQNAALVKFNTAVAKSGLELNKLNQIQDKLSRNNFFDGDTINDAMVLATQLGLDEEQINNVMTAATDLAASGVMPLDQAVKTLSQSYAGNVTQLKKIAPEISELTSAEIKNGAAVEVIKKQYAGFADVMSNTFSGRSTQWANSVDDLKAAIGSIPESLKFISEGKLLEPLNNVTKWIKDNRNYIINFFLHLPEVMQTVLSSIGGMIQKTWEHLPELISMIGPLLWQAAKDGFSTFFSIASEVFQGMYTLLYYTISNPFKSSKDFVSIFLNNIIEGINDLPQHFPDWIKRGLGIDESTEPIKFRFKVESASGDNVWITSAKLIEQDIENIVKTASSGSKKLKSDWDAILEAMGQFYGDDIDAMKAKLEEILGQDLPAELQAALDGLAVPTPKEDDSDESSSNSSLTSSLISSAGEIGSIITAAQQNGWAGVLVYLAEQVVDVMADLSDVVSDALGVISYTLELILPPVIAIVETWLSHIFVFIEQVADIVSNLLEIFEPLTTWLGQTVILSLFVPVITVLDLIYNAVTAIRKWFGYTGEYRSIEDDIAALVGATLSSSSYTASGSSSTSSGASYTAQRDVTVNITYSNSFVNGDAREIALAIEEELESAHALGY